MNVPTDLIWAAGFFDGEGCVSVVLQKRGDFMVRLFVGNTNVQALFAFKEMFGGTIYERPAKSIRHKTAYQWQVVSGQAFRALEQLLPYLRVKREQAELALQFRQFAAFDDRTLLLLRLRELNRRGPAA